MILLANREGAINRAPRPRDIASLAVRGQFASSICSGRAEGQTKLPEPLTVGNGGAIRAQMQFCLQVER
jgi:hypothetical protein